MTKSINNILLLTVWITLSLVGCKNQTASVDHVDNATVSSETQKAKTADDGTTLIGPGFDKDTPIDQQWIVVFKEDEFPKGRSQQALQETHSRLNTIATENSIELSAIGYRYATSGIKGFAAVLDEEQVEKLEKDPRVKYLERNRVGKIREVKVTSMPYKTKITLPTEEIPWGVARVGGPAPGTGKLVWVLDTGIDLDHIDLNVGSRPASAISWEPSANDLNGHGTELPG